MLILMDVQFELLKTYKQDEKRNQMPLIDMQRNYLMKP